MAADENLLSGSAPGSECTLLEHGNRSVVSETAPGQKRIVACGSPPDTDFVRRHEPPGALNVVPVHEPSVFSGMLQRQDPEGGLGVVGTRGLHLIGNV